MARFALLVVFGLAACAGGNQEGAPVLLTGEAELLTDDRFVIEVVAENLDGYEVARCLAAGFVRDKAEADEEDYPFFQREGGQIKDEFRVKDGVRTQTSAGVQTYTILTESEDTPDGKDLMSVAAQLTRCERRELPTTPVVSPDVKGT